MQVNFFQIPFDYSSANIAELYLGQEIKIYSKACIHIDSLESAFSRLVSKNGNRLQVSIVNCNSFSIKIAIITYIFKYRTASIIKMELKKTWSKKRSMPYSPVAL
jgi:hypothetical protein